MKDRAEFARALRQRETQAEKLLWKALRGGRLDGLKFRRQHPVGRYFADFACESLRLVIELDGGVHDQDDIHLNDHIRQQEIEASGWFVLRFRNEQVSGALPSVLNAICAQVRMAGALTPHPPTQLR
ncbi:endonuclease domain-containing protein [Brevundimonas sp.]|jgi:very-short-patch-repair endonuclease|uniref:endonuclease domain-containing protein n=1 Tax=Brevundimonas sp. TaxID=1871086 RepID=UPI0037BFA88A